MLYFDPNRAEVHIGVSNKNSWETVCEADMNSDLTVSEIREVHEIETVLFLF